LKKTNQHRALIFSVFILLPVTIGLYQNCQKVNFATADPLISEAPSFQSDLSSEELSLKIEPATLVFDSQLLNNSSPAKTLLLTNPSDQNIVVQDIRFSAESPDSSDLSALVEEFILNQADIAGGCFQGMTRGNFNFVIGAGSSCTLQFQFRPKVVGQRLLQVSILSDDQSQITAQLKGAGLVVSSTTSTTTTTVRTTTSTTSTTTSTTSTTMVTVVPAKCGPAVALIHSGLPETGLCDMGEASMPTYQSTSTRSINWKCVVTAGVNETDCSAEPAAFHRHAQWMGNGWQCLGSGIGPNMAGELQFESHGAGVGCGRAVYRIRIDGSLQMQSSSCGPC
jgi:hypothetical protein